MPASVRERPPVRWYTRPGRRHGYLRTPAGYENGEGDPERRSPKNLAREDEPDAVPGFFDPSRCTGVGRLESETVAVLHRSDLVSEAAGDLDQFPGGAVRVHAPAEKPRGQRRQRRGDEEATGFQVEFRLHDRYGL